MCKYTYIRYTCGCRSPRPIKEARNNGCTCGNMVVRPKDTKVRYACNSCQEEYGAAEALVEMRRDRKV